MVLDAPWGAIIPGDSQQYATAYDGAGKKLLDKVYGYDGVYNYKLKEDRKPDAAPDYKEIGRTAEKEGNYYGKIYDGKNWRIYKVTGPASEMI